MIGDTERLRPHIKTNKAIEPTKLMIAAGIHKFKCATIAEAEMLGICEANDVLLAYQPNGPKLRRFVAVIKKFPATKYSCLTDNIDAAKQMAAVFDENNLNIPVYVDINVGMNRTGVEPSGTPFLYTSLAGLKGIIPVGLHAYDGHIRDINFELRKQKCDQAYQKVADIQHELQAKGFTPPIIVMGGSPGYSVHCKRKNIECSPGTFIYWDKGYSDLCPEQAFLTAALVVTRVISLPGPTKICLDLGHKSIAAENEISRRVYFLNATELKFVSQSEEHLVAEAGINHPYKVGDVLYGLPVHVCPTIALYERAITIENGNNVAEWKTIARDRKISC
jgi:D-serine deaminase-like pyridoxal phosphate-dependent protein